MFNGMRKKFSYLYYTKLKKMPPNEPSMIHIGNHVTSSSEVTFVTHDNSILKVLDPMTDVVGRITVGDHCFIGQNSILMLGVILGERCIVEAGAVVTHSYPANSVIAGNPARKICTIEEMAEKYKNYAIDFGAIPFNERNQWILEHPEKMVVR